MMFSRDNPIPECEKHVNYPHSLVSNMCKPPTKAWLLVVIFFLAGIGCLITVLDDIAGFLCGTTIHDMPLIEGIHPFNLWEFSWTFCGKQN